MKEFDLISQYLRPLSKTDEAAGLADDVSVIPQLKRPAVITTDTLVEHIHFNSYDPMDLVGAKLVRVNVSDCYAKAALPRFALFNLTWPSNRTDDDLRLLLKGLKAELEHFGIDLIGGDTTSAQSDIVLSLSLIGECQREDGPVRRGGLSVGDDLWVSGTIGDAFLGLKVSQSSEQAHVWPELKSAYLVPVLPSVAIVDCVGRFATASVDISDGLIADAGHMATVSGVQIVLREFLVPVSDAAAIYLDKHTDLGMTDLMSGGDDYQVLFGAPENVRQRIRDFAIESKIRLTRIGEARQGEGVLSLDESGKPSNVLRTGWEHGKTE